MKFSVNQIELNDAIQSVSKIIGKSTIPALSGILFDASGSKLRLVGSDAKITIEAFIDTKIEKNGSAVIPAGFISELIRKLPPELINFSMDEKGNISINCAQLKYNILSYNANEFPEIQKDSFDQELNIDKDILDKIIKQVRFSIAKDETRPVLTGALFEFTDNELTVVSIDGYRMSLKKVNIENNINCVIIIPDRALLEIQKIISSSDAGEKIKITIGENQLCFEYGDVKLTSNKIAGEFTNYNQIIPKDIKSVVTIDRELFTQSIDRSMLVIRNNKNQAIKFNITDDNLKIDSTSEIGSSQEIIPIKLEGEDIVIGFNPKFIIEMLKVVESESLVIKFTNPVGPCLISQEDNDDYLYMLLPCRL